MADATSAATVTDSGDCITDLDAYRGQERLFGAQASETTTYPVLKSVDERLLGCVRGWAGGGQGADVGRRRAAGHDHAEYRRDAFDRALRQGAGRREQQARVRLSSTRLLA